MLFYRKNFDLAFICAGMLAFALIELARLGKANAMD